MPDYQQAKIYRILSDAPDSLIYIGSTTRPLLSQRMSQHRASYKRYQSGDAGKVGSYDLFDKYGVVECKIELLEIYPCNSKDELAKQEGQHIRNNECVNKNIAGRSRKEYQLDNRDVILEKGREYAKLYHEQHKALVLQKHKEYSAKHWEVILAQQRARRAKKNIII
jgi:hypothetical protein